MASTSRGDGTTRRIKNTAATLYSDNQSLVADIRKAMGIMKEIAVDFERDNEFTQVKDMETAVAELLESYQDCAHHAWAIESVGNRYQPGTELTDFRRLLEAEFLKLKESSSLMPQDNPLMRQFREAVWNVHHAGQPMPGDEQEDIVMTSTHSNLLNLKCPISGKPVTELTEPVRSMECKHIYEKKVVMAYIASNRGQAKCPMSACPKVLYTNTVLCDPMLLVEIEELHSMSNQNVRPNVIEDFTELDEEWDN